MVWVDLGLGGGTGQMVGVGVAGAPALHLTKLRQNTLIHWRVGGIIQINHAVDILFSKIFCTGPSFPESRRQKIHSI